VRALDATLPLVVMTAWSSVELAVEAMRRGARDFVEKPWDNERLIAVVRTQVELGQALRRGQRLEAENRILRDDGGVQMIAESRAMRPVLQMIERVGPSDANVLVTGENGTGKGLVARALRGVSGRAAKPMVTVNVGGLSDGVFESELFGHVRGAFTDAKADRVGRFELADGGTLFLDEIANVGLNQQAKLLRVLETGEFERVGASRTKKVDVRIISATNRDVAEAVAGSKLREDLLYRLHVFPIGLPPLRERGDDIPLIARSFLQDLHHADGGAERFSPAALSRLSAYHWPGNVRELRNIVQRAWVMATGPEVGDEWLPPPTVAAAAPAVAARALPRRDVPTAGLDETVPAEPEPGGNELLVEVGSQLADVERRVILATYESCGRNKERTAAVLGISMKTLYNRLKEYRL